MSTKRPKVIVVLPAHNAEKTLKASLARLPKKFIDEIILVDDASTDNTFTLAKKLKLKAFRNLVNLGYGGNLKVCLTQALKAGADIIIEYHPDNQYDPIVLPEFLEKAKHGYDFILGSRFVHPKEALDRKMPLTKFIANRALSFIDQFILGIELSEFHSGFRLYTKKLLENVPYLQNSDDYLFSFEIIVQAVYFKYNIADIKIACDYHPKMHTANLRRSSIYALGTFKTLTQYVISKFYNRAVGPFRKVKPLICPLCLQHITRREYNVQDAISRKNFLIFWCTPCQISFTTPLPSNFSEFYPKTYYSKIKTLIYQLLQYRRPELIKKLISKGEILDVGCGDGEIGNKLVTEGYHYTGIETPFAQVKNPLVQLTTFEGFKQKSNKYEIVTFWESFEHLVNPKNAIRKTAQLLKSKGFIVIECPNYGSWERLLFFARWFHLDPPRHTFHFTSQGLSQLLIAHGFINVSATSVYAPEYTPIGLAMSMLYILSPNNHILMQTKKSIASILVVTVFIVLAIVAIPISYVFYLLHGSPIQLVIAQKK